MKRNQIEAQSRLSFIDLFSGCGGLSLGLLNAGWRGLFAIEQNPDAFKTLQHNLVNKNNHYTRDKRFDWPDWLMKEPHEITTFLRKYHRQLEKIRGEVNLVAGGTPCQGFSFAGRRTANDPRNELFKYHLRIVDILRPELVLMENVQGIEKVFRVGKNEGKRTRGRPGKSYASRIRDMLRKHGYDVQQNILWASDFGVPQYRPRYFTLGIRQDLLTDKAKPDFIAALHQVRDDFLRCHGLPTDHPITVSEAISDLTTIDKQLQDCTDDESPHGFAQIVYKGPSTSYQRLMNSHMDGQTPNSCRLVKHRPETVALFQEILTSCRKGVTISKKDRIRFGLKKTAIVPLTPDKPSHTLTTIPDDLLHYIEPRIHTVREHARLQSFPDWFEFRGKYTTGGRRRTKDCPRYTQVGNAVPPLLAEIIGEALENILRNLTTTNYPEH